MALVVAFLIWKWKKSIEASVLIAYLFIGFAAAVLNRSPSASMRFQLGLFWSYGYRELYSEITANILLYIPVGFLACMIWKKTGILFSIVFSIFVELVQLIGHRGLFEFDDIIHNTLGAVIGYMILQIGLTIREHKE